MPAPSPPSLELRVAVFATDPETLDGLTDYLRAAGARAIPRNDLTLAERAEVIVLFGDDFEPAASEELVRAWAASRGPRAILILVTSQGSLAESVRPDPRAVVLRRPVWGWVLLAAIQSGLRDATRLEAGADPIGGRAAAVGT